ncbi:adenosylcobinamide-phosphate synthase CbiB [Trichothermofontia sp.]
MTGSNVDTGIVLGLAALLDYAIADPWSWPHPVQFMGWFISRYMDIFLSRSPAKPLGVSYRLAGVGLALGLVIGSGLMSGLLLASLTHFHPKLGQVGAIVLLASCFAGRSLRRAAEDVLQPLIAGDVMLARDRLSRYVGRETANLTEPEILRAILETVAENATDGVLAPLVYAGLGAMIPAIGPVPLAIAYKAASTLDSMVGYRELPYTDLGWFSARLEDVLTWLPCRLAVLTLAILSGNPKHIWSICQRDAPADPSPNSGWSECAYAAVLGVQLGGINIYRGTIKQKPYLGDPIQPITPAIVDRSLQLTRFCFLIWLGLLLVVLLAVPIVSLRS